MISAPSFLHFTRAGTDARENTITKYVCDEFTMARKPGKVTKRQRSYKKRESNQRVLRSDEKVTIVGDADIPVWGEGDGVGKAYWRVPITSAIPIRQPAGAGPDDRHRESKKVFVRGVCVRFVIMLHAAHTVDIIGVLYNAKVQVSSSGEYKPVRLDGMSHTFHIGAGSAEKQRLLTIEETQMLSRGGPFGMINGANGQALDAIDGTLFTARLASGKGGPIGKVGWRDQGQNERQGRIFRDTFRGSNLMTLNYMNDLSVTANLGSGYTHDSKQYEIWFEINRLVMNLQHLVMKSGVDLMNSY